MAGKKGQKKRIWSDEEKGSICRQARVPGISVAQVARRYAMNANLIHKWLRDPKFGSVVRIGDLPALSEATFLPIEIVGAPAVPAVLTPSLASIDPVSNGPVTAQRLDITLSDGRRILVEGATTLSAVLAMVEGLAQ